MSRNKSSLGNSLIRDHKRKAHFVIKDGYRHTSDLQDGRDFARLNLKSVTEQTSLDDFLDTTKLAENDYINELGNIQFVDPTIANGLLTDELQALVASAQDKNREILRIPRRPYWDRTMSKEELDAKERESFLVWRRTLSMLQAEEHINLTPFEKNLEIWRQLWRVIERSDIVIQIMDARNPLLFRCTDLEAYVKEVYAGKLNMLLLNKADLLTEKQRQYWSDYFENLGVKIVFFSALQEMKRPQDADSMCTEESNEIQEDNKVLEENLRIQNSAKILSREELICFLKDASKYIKKEHTSAIGLVGYPNVGKSSTLNAILMSKKVCVSATPGKTKHFQTHIIDQDICLCDCPGLIFPNFVSTKAEMVIGGILPIDQLTNWVQPVSILTNLIPRNVLESAYSIIISLPLEGEDSKRPPTAEEFLSAHSYNRGFMKAKGRPDVARSARYILKDFVNGKLLYCYAPPGINQEEYHTFPKTHWKKATVSVIPLEDNIESDIVDKKVVSEIDRKFFNMSMGEAHTKGVKGDRGLQKDEKSESSDNKPWKKHHNRNRKEKLRRIYKNPYE